MEYYAPIWLDISNTQEIDAQLGNAIRMTADITKLKRTEWLPVQSHFSVDLCVNILIMLK